MRPGQQLCGCTLERELGRGGAGAVYLARDPHGRPVAVKVLLTHSPRQRERFRREVQAVQRLKHPGVVQILAADLDHQPPCLVMEYVPGGDLQTALRAGQHSRDQLLELLEQVCRAVHKAHSLGIVHRDLKPANILVSHEGRARITDFGVVRDLAGGSSLTATGTMVGTLPYMSPEQVKGLRQLGPASDVYSLGVVLYEVLTGHLPHTATSALELAGQIMSLEPPAPSSHDPELTEAHDALCARALAKRPEDRPASALALALGIADLRKRRAAPSSRSPWPWVAVAGVLLLAGALALLATVVPSVEESPDPPASVASEAGPGEPSTPAEPATPQQPSATDPVDPRLRACLDALEALDRDRALELTTALIAEDPSASVRLAHARALDMHLKFEDARGELELLVERAGPGEEDAAYDALLMLTCLPPTQRKDVPPEYERAIRLRPERPEAYQRRAAWWVIRGRWEEPGSTADADLRKALELAPRDPQVLATAGFLSYRRGLRHTEPEPLLADAERLYERAIDAGTRDPDIYARRALLNGTLDREEEREADFAKSLELYRNEQSLTSFFVSRARARRTHVEQNFERKKLVEALLVLDRARGQSPRHALVEAEIGALLVLRCKGLGPSNWATTPQQARGVLESALTYHPQVWEAVVYTAELHVFEGTEEQLEADLAALKRVEHLVEKLDRWRLLAARCRVLTKLERYLQAEAACEELVRLLPGVHWAEEQLGLARQLRRKHEPGHHPRLVPVYEALALGNAPEALKRFHAGGAVPENAEFHLAFARICDLMLEFQKAIGELQLVLEKAGPKENRRRYEALILMASLLKLRDRDSFQDGLALYAQAAAADRTGWEARTRRGVLILESGRTEANGIRAYDELLRGVQLGPDEPEAMCAFAGWVIGGIPDKTDPEARRKEAFSASQWLKRALSSGPYSGQVHGWRAILHQTMGHPGPAANQRVLALQKYRAMQDRPGYFYKQARYIFELHMQGQSQLLPRMYQALLRVASLDSRHPLAGSLLVFARLQRATSSGSPQTAVRVAKEALTQAWRVTELYPRCWEAWCYQGTALAFQPEPDREAAKRAFETSLALVPAERRHEVLTMRANAWIIFKEWERAIEDATQATQLESTWVVPWATLELAAKELGRADAAAAAQRKIQELREKLKRR